MTRWPIGSVTLENRHLYTREQLEDLGVILRTLEHVDPRVLHIVEQAFRQAAEALQRGRIVIHELRTEGSEIVINASTLNAHPADHRTFEMIMSSLKRDVREELGA